MVNPNRKKKEPKSEKEKEEGKNVVIQPMKVEIKFTEISALKVVPDIDKNGRLVLSVGFVAVTDQYEIFRLVNLLRQPHAPLYAFIGTSQSAMDFDFSEMKSDKVSVIRSEKEIPAAKQKKLESNGKKKRKSTSESDDGLPPAEKLHDVTFNYIPEEEKPFGVAIDYVDSKGEIHTVAGRGMDPIEAVLEGVDHAHIFQVKFDKPSQYAKALEKFDLSPVTYKLIRVIEVGTFDIPEFEEKDTEEDGDK